MLHVSVTSNHHQADVSVHGHDMFIATVVTLRSRVLLEKLAGLQLVNKFPAFYGTRRFITAFTNAQPADSANSELATKRYEDSRRMRFVYYHNFGCRPFSVLSGVMKYTARS
jgi:hypothetical protein